MSFWASIGGSAIASGMVLALFRRWLKNKDKKDDDRAKTAQEENILIMNNLIAVGHVAATTAKALKDNHFDGNIDEALDYYTKAKDGMNDFLIRQNAVNNH
jgi:hypothetical protein